MYDKERWEHQRKIMDNLPYEEPHSDLSKEHSEILKTQYNMRQRNKIKLFKQCIYITLPVYIMAIIISIPFIQFDSNIYYNDDIILEVVEYNIKVAKYYFGYLLLFSCVPTIIYVFIRYLNYKTLKVLPQATYADVCVKLAHCNDEWERKVIKSFMRSINDSALEGKLADSQTIEALQTSLSNLCRE